ncbi:MULTISPECIES: DUF6074 family protein [Rhizobium/Agrobacterium group]|uniref:DUF6074 family protein n=1 Tax=Rhizobium/Agrobacterium group TaxID=227290 RepID=UPI00107FBA68|nr:MULTISPECIES: DUF6074 family protein [Rhizobium/Agrobacterium group]MBB4402562.1 hypothetical protein [Agrobacterium radiobacter]MBB5588716.1 hypothetical protein [Agrobacterium radiobacter]TGE89161.1 hypothetical protein C9418_12465 [Rhizobium sp. SEMIA 4032]
MEVTQTAQIIPFPVDHEVLFIRETARILMIRQGPSAGRFWQMTCRRLYARLQVQGMAHADIDREVKSFSAAVFAQIDRVTALQHHNPRGAA